MSSSPEEEIPFGAVVSLTNRGKYIYLNDRLRPMGLSAAQFPIIMLLAKEQNIMQERLVRHYHLDKGTIARSVRKLEDAGYIRRITDPANRRAVRLFLTAKGEQAVPVLRVINNDWETLAYRNLTAQDKTTVNVLMHTIAGNCLTYMKKSGGPFNAGE